MINKVIEFFRARKRKKQQKEELEQLIDKAYTEIMKGKIEDIKERTTK